MPPYVQDSAIIEAKQIIADRRNLQSEIRAAHEALAEAKKLNQTVEQHYNNIQTLINQKRTAFPWLAKAFADYWALCDDSVARKLEAKSRPAYKAAEKVREISGHRRLAIKKAKLLEYRLRYYENMFPWLVELLDDTIEDCLLEDGDLVSSGADADDAKTMSDPVRKWLSPAEYKRLAPEQRDELALSRYDASNKSKWMLGIEYERYVGYLYEKAGYKVRYIGAISGLDDLGRDLIAVKARTHLVIQCKRWSKHKQIHEKHVFQLLGTLLEYAIDNSCSCNFFNSGTHDQGLFESSLPDAVGVLYVTNQLSPRASRFAERLKIEVHENVQMECYPRIKCNVSGSGEKIYHLPFDQQYDRVVIEPEKGEFYASTPSEAIVAGFRRAFRYRGG